MGALGEFLYCALLKENLSAPNFRENRGFS